MRNKSCYQYNSLPNNIELTTKNLIYGPASNPGRSPFKPAVILTFSPIEYKGFSESTERVEIKAMFPRSLKTENTARCQHERRSKARFFQRRSGFPRQRRRTMLALCNKSRPNARIFVLFIENNTIGIKG